MNYYLILECYKMKEKIKIPDTKKEPTQASQPGKESEMHDKPLFEPKEALTNLTFANKVIVITGGDSGIGKAVALAFAKTGGNIAFLYYNEEKDAENTLQEIEKMGVKVHAYACNISDANKCKEVTDQIINTFGKIDVLINCAAVQFEQTDPRKITPRQVDLTFGINILGAIYLTIAVLPHLKEGASIINTTSVTAYRGSKHLIDYSSTKAALVGFTRSLSTALAKDGIRVNAVAPGPVWTPLIPSSFSKSKLEEFGKNTPMGRAGQPNEIAPSYLFLASDNASFITGQVIHPNGGEIVNA